MKKIIALAPIALSACINTGSEKSIPQKPNIIYILADDLGYGDLGCYGQDSIPTPFIDQMAEEGMMFTNHYAGSTVCAPSRCALMTGLHTGHCLVRGNARVPLRKEDVTVAELLKDAGYKTALFGKWGLGNPGTTGTPNIKGFDEFTGYLSQSRAHNAFPDYIWENEDTLWLDNKLIPMDWGKGKEVGGAAIEKNTHTQDLFTKKAHIFIEENKENPFFLYLAYTLPHANNEAKRVNLIGMESPDSTLFKDKPWPPAQQAHAGMISSLDKDVGSILNQLKELGIEKNTLVIFTSDNGPHREGGAIPEFFDSNGELQGIKRDLFEGGIRVPMIAWWPETIQPGSKSDHISAFWDFMPTACEIADINPEKNTDGISFLPTLKGNTQQKHDYLYWEFFEQGGRTAIRKDNWKAIRYNVSKNPDAPIQLYDVEKDIGEENNLADTYPELIEEFKVLFQESRTPSQDFQFEFEKN